MLQNLKVCKRITTQLARIASEQNMNGVAPGVQVAGHHVAVTAIVPLTTANDYGPANAQFPQPLRGRPSGILHENDARYLKFLDRSAIELANEFA
jgi:hypothetical protein